MLEEVEYDGELPAIGVVPAGASWADVQDHIKIAHSPLLIRLDGAEQYAGVYWTGTAAVVVEELGPDVQEAIDEFREFLIEHGEI